MIAWIVATLRDVKVALEKAKSNGFVYDASFQLHHKKPGVSPMQRDLKKVGGRGKTAQIFVGYTRKTTSYPSTHS
jgi:hypothetical protein